MLVYMLCFVPSNIVVVSKSLEPAHFYFIFQVEMFGVTADETGQESSQLLDEFVLLQKDIFSSLNLHFRF